MSEQNVPAFPCTTYYYENGVEQVNDRFAGMTMRQWYKGIAPADEIDGLIGATIRCAAEFIGMPEDDYDPKVHYILAVKKARGMWADALLAEDAEHEVK